MVRTTTKVITFNRPFTVSGADGLQPAGSYTVETDEELVEGISFPAYHRVDTRIQLAAVRAGIVETISVDPAELDAALSDHAHE